MIKKYDGIMPSINNSTFIAESADVIGNVELKENANVWYNAVIRGDSNKIVIGENSNIQDGTVIHCSEKHPTIVGNNVTVGHACILHGCTIADYTLVGMGSIVLDGAEISEFTMIGAGTLVTSKKFPPGVLLLGSPAKVVRELTEEEKEKLKKSAQNYVETAKKHK